MSFAPTIPGEFNPEWDATLGRRGRWQHGYAPDFTPLDLGNDLLLWFDPRTLDPGDIVTWTDVKAGKTLIPAGTGAIPYDGSMIPITTTAFLFGNNTWNFANPFEIWQLVDQTEAAGSANSTSLAFGSGPASFAALYTPDIGGQSSASVNGQTLFGGDDYHGVHVIRWQISNGRQLGWLDGKPGVQAAVGYTDPLEPASFCFGANVSGANLWKGRLGDTVATKALSSGEVNAMWEFMRGRIPLAPAPAAFSVTAGDGGNGDTGFRRTLYGSVSAQPLTGEVLDEFATRNPNYFQVNFIGDVTAKVKGWQPYIAGINIGTLVSDWKYNGTSTEATWDGGDTMTSPNEYAVTWERM